MIASFPISVGPAENETPPGDHTIKQSVLRPVFRYDKKMLKEGVRGEEAWVLPPGPNNPVGVIWNQTSRDGIGLHGTHDPDLIGRNISSGCVRLSKPAPKRSGQESFPQHPWPRSFGQLRMTVDRLNRDYAPPYSHPIPVVILS
jgi:hypothetical protein